MKIAISTNADKDKVNGWAWGDHAVKHHLGNAFRELGHEIVDDDCDLLLELFGGAPNLVHKYEIKACWFCSHPEMMSLEIAKGYDIVFSLSKPWAEVLQEELPNNGKVFYLPGCGHCVPPESWGIMHDVVFVGNARWRGTKYGRPIINDLDPGGMGLCSEPYMSLELYGLHWQDYPAAVPYYKAPEWPNLKLNELYGRAKISLSDCYENMREHAFVSIRIIDILLSGGFCISNDIKGIREMFKEAVVTYKSPGDLQDKVRYYLNNEKAREKKIKKGMELVKEHTYLNRAKEIMEAVNDL